MKRLESFSIVANEFIRLRLALYGPEDAQALIKRCYRRSKSEKINERTVLAAWTEQDEAIRAALEVKE